MAAQQEIESFLSVQAIFNRRCVRCHGGTEPEAGMSLESGRAHRSVVNVPSVENPNLMRVDPNRPDDSYLMRKISRDMDKLPYREAAMPFNDEKLDDRDIAAIRRWIQSFPEELWGEAESQTVVPSASEDVRGFLATQLMYLPTTRVLGTRTAEFRILHRFGLINGGGNQTFRSFFGLDNGATTSLNLLMSIRPNMDLLFRRTGANKDIEMAVKYVPFPSRLGRPWSLGVHVGFDWISRENNGANRFSPNVQLLSSYAVHSNLIFLVVPTLTLKANHSETIVRDGVLIKDTRSTFAVGLGAQYEFLRNTALTAEYIPRLSGYRGIAAADDPRFNTWALGVAYKIRLHVFQVLLSNTQVLHTTQFIPGSSAIQKNTLWDRGANFHFGFNIIRQFKW